MAKKKGIEQNWKKISSQLKEAERFLEEEKLDEALYFIWLAAENIINNLKVAINGFYLKDHKAKTDILKDYFALGTLKRDYSKVFEKLSKYRLVAEFHPYTSIKRDYTREDVINYLKEMQELKNEVERFLIKKGII
jgi:uncharacterized protein YutE (UPF0331/DUF86 family)